MYFSAMFYWVTQDGFRFTSGMLNLLQVRSVFSKIACAYLKMHVLDKNLLGGFKEASIDLNCKLIFKKDEK